MTRSYDESEIPSVYSAADIPAAEVIEGATMRVFRGLDQMLGFSTLQPGLEVEDTYSHPWEQITLVREGTCEVTVADETFAAGPGDVFFVPPGVEHAVEPTSEEPCELLDVWPVREDYLEGTDYQREFPGEE